MGGHLFIIDGDLTKIACDALLIPTDNRLHITDHWKPYLADGGYFDEIAGVRRTGWQGADSIALTRTRRGPWVWLGRVGQAGDTSRFERFGPRVEDFVRRSTSQLRKQGRKSRIYDWDRPRIAIPIIGTDKGGGSRRKGELILGLVELLTKLSQDPKVDADIILVAYGAKPYAAAQRARREVIGKTDDDRLLRSYWRFENEPRRENLVRKARDLAAIAIDSQLVLFLGAGISMGAGLPGWNELLSRVAKDVAFKPQRDLSKADPRDQATVLQRRLEVLETGGKTLGGAVAMHLTDSPSHYSLAHGLLASFPSKEAVTTNFDTLFELACETAGRSISVLPKHVAPANGRWLLKLHGCISEPDALVLTRADYLDMPRTHGALMGLVQGLLMMRHMVFVGYSMRDEDFHEIIHEVRQALGTHQGGKQFGTVLTLRTDPLSNELWTKDLQVCAMTGSDSNLSEEQCSRQLELFLDLVGYLATTSAAFFLDQTYDALSEGERSLRSELSRLYWEVQGREDDSVSAKVLRFLEDQLGADRDLTRRNPGS